MERRIIGLDRQMLHIRLLFGAFGPAEILYSAPCLSSHPRLELAPTAGEESPAMAPGEVAEWSNAPHSKCGIGASLSGVRIPPSPPFAFAGFEPRNHDSSGSFAHPEPGRQRRV